MSADQSHFNQLESPLDIAISQRDKDVLHMVRAALDKKQAMLAFQPIVLGHPPYDVSFYEGLIRILDHTGRVIPAREFMPTVEATEMGREVDCLSLALGISGAAPFNQHVCALNWISEMEGNFAARTKCRPNSC